jgi:hypothetical protein
MTGDLSVLDASLVRGQWKKMQISVQGDGGGKPGALKNADYILNDQKTLQKHGQRYGYK